MILLTDDIRDQLLTNGKQRDIDHVPVVKLFNPVGAGTWLISEMEADGDTLFGLADLGSDVRSWAPAASPNSPRCACRSASGSNATSCFRRQSRYRSMPRQRAGPATSWNAEICWSKLRPQVSRGDDVVLRLSPSCVALARHRRVRGLRPVP